LQHKEKTLERFKDDFLSSQSSEMNLIFSHFQWNGSVCTAGLDL